MDRPKRRKSKDNPYTLSCDDKYEVTFKHNGISTTVEVTKEVYDELNNFELLDLKQLNEYDRHIEHSELYEESLYQRTINKPISVEEQVNTNITSNNLKKAINDLPEIQRRRLKKYYFDNMTLEEIATEENCSKMAIKFSIDIAIDKLSKKIKK